MKAAVNERMSLPRARGTLCRVLLPTLVWLAIGEVETKVDEVICRECAQLLRAQNRDSVAAVKDYMQERDRSRTICEATRSDWRKLKSGDETGYKKLVL